MTWDVTTDTVEVEIDMATETPIAADWGEIGGTLSDQTDLQTALNAKLSEAPTDGKTYGRKNGAWAEVTGGGGGGTSDHTQLTNRDAANQHPISAINGLQAALDGKGTYSKPASGIPKADLASSVQTSLGKADTAIQEHQSLAAYRTAAQQDAIHDATKQDVVSDLSTIRSGAAAGSTAYQKPASGIPKTDLASGVQSSLDKADSAIQQHQSLAGYATQAWVEAKGYITSLAGYATEAWVNAKGYATEAWVTAKNYATQSWVEGKGYLTQHQSLADYRTSAAQDVIDAGKASTSALATETANRQTADTILGKRAVNLEQDGLGSLRRVDTDTTAAYSKAVPAGAMPYAKQNMVGGKTIVMNQIIENGNFDGTTGWTTQNATLTASNNVGHIVVGNEQQDAFIYETLTLQRAHRYVLLCTMTSSHDGSVLIALNAFSVPVTANTPVSYVRFWRQGSDKTNSFDFKPVQVSGATLDISNIMILDLTAIFGEGNEPTTETDLKAMLPNAYYDYDSGTLLDMDVVNIKSKDTDNATIANIAISQAVRNLCPCYGMSNGTDYNYIDFTTRVYHQLVGSRAYQSGDENDATVTTDGTTTHYTLATPATVDLSSVLSSDNLIEVEAGGTLTFENSNGTDYLIPVPNGEDFTIDITAATLAAKQDTISDLSTIRSGAELGATALQSVPNTYRTAAEQDAIHDATKQDTLTNAQLAAANSGITSADKTKLDGIAAGAEVNVQSDWNATSGDAQILNKPTIPDVSGKENTSNKVTSISSASTDAQYPSAKCVYDIVGNIETLLGALL